MFLVVQHQTRLKTKLGEEKSELKKCVKLTEDARAAEIRARKKNLHIDPSSTGKVIEIDPYADADADQKRVRFAGEGSRRNPNVLVRHLGKENISRKPGIEAAIREENARRQLTLEQKKAARMRGLAALRRAKMERPPRTTESYFEDTDPDATAGAEDTDTDVSQSINAQVTWRRRPTPDENDEVDFIPSRLPRPSSSTTSSINDSAESSLHATISRPSIRGAFDLRETDIHTIPPGTDIVRQFHGQASGAKSNIPAPAPSTATAEKHKKEQDFIAKVLEGFEMSDRENLQVNIEVEEQTTLHSSASSSRDDTTGTTTYSSPNSSSDITREKFLSKEWKTTTDIKKLIGTLRSDDRKQSDTTRKNMELKTYIERLLKMKREEIANLSITDTTSEMSSISNNNNNISSPSIESETTTQQGFASSTPASILVSSGTSSSGKSSQSKSVRFKDQDELDATYRPSSSKLILSKEEEEKVKFTVEVQAKNFVKSIKSN